MLKLKVGRNGRVGKVEACGVCGTAWKSSLCVDCSEWTRVTINRLAAQNYQDKTGEALR